MMAIRTSPNWFIDSSPSTRPGTVFDQTPSKLK
jgi:hypothetical protein